MKVKLFNFIFTRYIPTLDKGIPYLKVFDLCIIEKKNREKKASFFQN